MRRFPRAMSQVNKVDLAQKDIVLHKGLIQGLSGLRNVAVLVKDRKFLC